MKIVKPIRIDHTLVTLTWAINIYQGPLLSRLRKVKFNYKGKFFLNEHRSCENSTVPNGGNATRGTLGRFVREFIKSSRAARLEEQVINVSIFVSCRQTTAQPLEDIAFDKDKSLGSEFNPLTFQHNIFQFAKSAMIN